MYGAAIAAGAETYGDDKTAADGAAISGADWTTWWATAWLTVCALYDDAYGATIAAAGITPAWAAAMAKMAIIYMPSRSN